MELAIALAVPYNQGGGECQAHASDEEAE